MTFNQLLNACPNTFKVIGLSDHYEFQCKKCSYQRSISKQKAKASEWGATWQMELSQRLESHQEWHTKYPDKSYEEEKIRQMNEDTREAVRKLNELFGITFSRKK